MTLIWNTVTVPTEWLHATITCLFKKGIRKLAANYRGISIRANMSRILAKIIIMRLKEAYEKVLVKHGTDFVEIVLPMMVFSW